MSSSAGPQPDRGRDDYHDPTAGIAGAPPARSALTLRLVLAAFGLVVCVAATVLFALIGALVAAGVAAAIALLSLVDLAVVVRRKRQGEPG